MTFHFSDGRDSRTFAGHLNASQEQIELDILGGYRPIAALCSVSGNRLEICVSTIPGTRPQRITSESGDDTALWTLERE